MAPHAVGILPGMLLRGHAGFAQCHFVAFLGSCPGAFGVDMAPTEGVEIPMDNRLHRLTSARSHQPRKEPRKQRLSPMCFAHERLRIGGKS
jgi:hypothetical protein